MLVLFESANLIAGPLVAVIVFELTVFPVAPVNNIPAVVAGIESEVTWLSLEVPVTSIVLLFTVNPSPFNTIAAA